MTTGRDGVGRALLRLFPGEEPCQGGAATSAFDSGPASDRVPSSVSEDFALPFVCSGQLASSLDSDAHSVTASGGAGGGGSEKGLASFWLAGKGIEWAVGDVGATCLGVSKVA